MSIKQQAVRKRTKTRAEAAKRAPEIESRSKNSGPPGLLHSARPHARPLGVQTKLSVGRPGDRYEREADGVAERVAQGGPAGDISRIGPGGLSTQRKAEQEPEPAVQRRSGGGELADLEPKSGTSEPATQPVEQRESNTAVQKQSETNDTTDRASGSGCGCAQTKSDGSPDEPEIAQTKREDKSLKPIQRQSEEPTSDEGSSEQNAQAQNDESSSDQSDSEQSAQTQADETSSDQSDSGTESSAQSKSEQESSDDGAQTQSEESSSNQGTSEESAQAQAEESSSDQGASEESAQTQADETSSDQSASDTESSAQTESENASANENAQTQSEESSSDQGTSEESAQAQAEESSSDQGASEESAQTQADETSSDQSASNTESDVQSKSEQESSEDGAQTQAEENSSDQGTSEESAQTQAEESSNDQSASDTESSAQTESENESADENTQTQAEEHSSDQGDSEESAQTQADEGSSDQEASDNSSQMQTENESESEEGKVQTKAIDATAPSQRLAPIAARAIANRAAGEPLRPEVQSVLERSFGVDLGKVRIHRDSNAGRATRDMRAKAFTNREHIYLAPSQSPDDMKLIAHETTHVLQQGGVQRDSASAPTRASTTAIRGARAAAAFPGTTPKQEPDKGSQQPTVPTGKESAVESPSTSEDRLSAAGEPPPGAAPSDEQKRRTEGADKESSEEQPDKAELTAEKEKEATNLQPITPEASDDTGLTDNPRVRGVVKRLNRLATGERSHGSASTKVSVARAAAEVPDTECVKCQAEMRHIGIMDQVKPSKTDATSFLELLKEQLHLIAPKDEEMFVNFKKKGGARGLKKVLRNEVKKQRDDASGDIRKKTTETPDESGLKAKPVGNPPRKPPNPKRPDLRSKQAVPLPKREVEKPFRAEKKKVDDLLSEYNIDEKQMEEANEPLFTKALKAKRAVDRNAEEGPRIFKNEENATLDANKGTNLTSEIITKHVMRKTREDNNTEALRRQIAVKEQEKKERIDFIRDINGIFKRTKMKVHDRLNKLDKTVDTIFDDCEKRTRNDFETYVEKNVNLYKIKRYVIGGPFAWISDWFFGVPDEINAFYREGSRRYVTQMESMLTAVAAIVDVELAIAKSEIAEGHKEVKERFKTLSDKQAEFGRQALKDIDDRFRDLERTVDEKKHELASRLARRYVQSYRKLKKRIEELKEENKGFISKAIDFIKAIGKILVGFKNTLMSLLKAGLSVIWGIVKGPISFFGNLVRALWKGFGLFKDNIKNHLMDGLLSYLTGALPGENISPPKSFEQQELLRFVMQLIGLSREGIRAMLVRIVGRTRAAIFDRVWGYVSVLLDMGPAGLLKLVGDKIGDLRSMLFDGIRDWLIVRVIRAGILWLVSLFNPATGLLRVIKLIIDSIIFFVQNRDAIGDLVKTVLNSISLIVAGNVAGAAKRIENAMARTIPFIIGFLARLLSLGGVSSVMASKVRTAGQRVRRKVERALRVIVRRVGKALFRRRRARKPAQARPAQARRPERPDGRTNLKVARAIASTLSRPARGKTIQQMVANKHKQAQSLQRRYRRRVARGLNISITLDDVAKTREDQAINFEVRIAPNNTRIPGKSVITSRATAPTGSKSDAIPIYWYKNTRDYHAIHFPNPQGHSRFDVPFGSIRFVMYNGRPRRIGINKRNIVQEGRCILRTSSGKSRTQAHEFRNMLYGLNYDLANEDIDHVLDLGFGGKDQISNLWPLSADINRNAFNFYTKSKIVFSKRYRGGWIRHRTNVMNGRGKWFYIVGFRSSPVENPLRRSTSTSRKKYRCR